MNEENEQEDGALLEGGQNTIFFCVDIYLVDRAWGGPQEGGWWYDTGHLVRDPLVFEKMLTDGKEALLPKTYLAWPPSFAQEEAVRKHERELQEWLDAGLNQGLRPISSMLSDGVYRARITVNTPEARFPAVRPHYE